MQTDVIFNTDALSALRGLDDDCVDCIVTSPPYWQLRDYGLAPILFGGNGTCRHEFDGFGVCRLCGGWLGQLGQEPSRELFIEHLVSIFDECRRVLKKSGTLWVNLGDSYSKLNKYNRPNDYPGRKNAYCLKELRVDLSAHRVPHKSLCNIPGLFAETMILRGWILRNEIIWYKPSVVPTPVKDRFTVDFEKVFFFAKSPKYDFRQQLEPYAGNETNRISRQPEHPTGSKIQKRPSRQEQTDGLADYDRNQPREALRPLSAEIDRNAYRGGVSAGRRSPRPFSGKRNDGPCRPQAGTPLHRHRAESGIRRHSPCTAGTGSRTLKTVRKPCESD